MSQPATARLSAADAADQVLEHGFVALPAVLDAAERRVATSALDEVIARGEANDIPTFGYAIHPLLTRQRKVGRFYAHPLITAVCAAVFADDVHLVHSGARVTDRGHILATSRIGWHNHAYTAEYRSMPVDDPRRGQRPRRLLFGWYLDGTDGGNGALVVLPRRFDDRLAPAGPDCTVEWPGEIDVLLPPGSAVVFTTDLWHSAKQPVEGAPRRYLMGAHVQARSDTTPHPEDHVHVGPEVEAAIAETPALGALMA